MMDDRRFRAHFDWALLWSVLLLVGVGLLNLYSACLDARGAVMDRFWVQVACAALGVVLMLLVTAVDYRVLDRLAWVLYAAALVLMALVLVVSPPKGGARGWIPLGPVNFQPIELAKIALIVVLAKHFHDNPSVSGYRVWELWKPVAVTAPLVGLAAVQPDLGGAMLLLLILGVVVLFVRIEVWTLAFVTTGALIAAPLTYFFLLKPYQQERILGFLDPEADRLGRGFNTIQSKIAIGSGQLFGLGWTNGTQSRLKILPAHHTDFIFSVLAQEWGFVGSVGALGLLFMLLYFGIRTASRSKERFGVILAFGVTAMFFLQVFVNVGGAIGLLPVTGVTLPFLSYGGSSLLVNFVAVGLLLNIGMRRFMF